MTITIPNRFNGCIHAQAHEEMDGIFDPPTGGGRGVFSAEEDAFRMYTTILKYRVTGRHGTSFKSE